MEYPYLFAEFSQFLQNELAISAAELALVVEKERKVNGSLPMLLWQYGLVSLEQLQQIFDWLDNQIELPILSSYQRLVISPPSEKKHSAVPRVSLLSDQTTEDTMLYL